MSTLKVDTIDNGSKVDFPNGFNVGGNAVSQGYTSSGSEPSSPNDGDFWYDSTNRVLYQYANDGFKKLPTKPAKYYPRNYKYVSTQKISVAGYDTAPRLFTIGSDDKTVVISGTSGDDLEINKLTTAKDMSTLPSAPNTGYGIASNFDTLPNGATWSTDGDYLFAVGQTTDDIDRWSCPTAFSLSGATNDQTNSTALATNPMSIQFSPDGTKIFMTNSSQRLYKGNLSTAWDISTSSLTMETDYADLRDGYNGINRGYNLAHYGGLFVDPNGYFVVYGTNRTRGGTLHWGQMTTAWDISTLSFDPEDARPLLQDECQNMYDFGFSSDGSHLYLLDAQTDEIVYLEWEAE